MKPVWTSEQVVAQLTNWGGRWNNNVPIPFMFYDLPLAHHDFNTGFASFHEGERQSLLRTLELVADVANVSFVNIASGETAPSPANNFMGFYTIYQSSAPFWGAATDYVVAGGPPEPMGQIYGVDIVVNHWRANVQGGWDIGNSNSRKLMHELLHGLGLDHAGNYNGDTAPGYEAGAAYFQDSNQYTVMSYYAAAETGANHVANGALQFASTPLLYDVAALQTLYGANMSTRTGDTVYGFNNNSGRAAFDLAADPGAVFTLWDAAGVDTLDLSGYSSASRVDLREGAFSDAGGMTSNISIAYGALIENAIGGAGDDSLTGNEAANRLTGGAGSDTLDGGGGADTMDGGDGDDIYIVDNVSDMAAEANAGGGTDIVRASASHTLGSNVEHLILLGTTAIDAVGNGLANSLTGNDAANVLDGGGGADMMTGGGGNDIYVVDDAGDNLVELDGGGQDAVHSFLSFNLAGSHLEQVVLLGTAAINATGDGLGNSLTGNAAANVLDGGAGADVMAGGGGDDRYIVDDAGDRILELSGGGSDLVESIVTFSLAGQDVEALTLLGAAALDGSGNALANSLTGNASANRLDGGAGADVMAGGLGEDIYVVDNALDHIIELSGGGIDTVESVVSHVLASEVEALTLTGIGAVDGSGNGLDNRITGNEGANVLDGGVGADLMTGGGGDDTYVIENGLDQVRELAGGGIDTIQSAISYTLGAELEKLVLTGTASLSGSGNALANVLTGNSGNNVLDGGAGADAMTGGAGDDIFHVDNAADIVSESASQGRDVVISAVSFALSGVASGVEELTLSGMAAINGAGNALANILTGNEGNNVLDGSAGADVMRGGAGDDIFHVDNAGDMVVENGSQGRDLVVSMLSFALSGSAVHVEDLTLAGSAAANATGNEVANTLTGNAAANVLNGGAGADVMRGGAGNDIFHVDNAGDVVVENGSQGRDLVVSTVSFALSGSAIHVEDLTLAGSAAVNATGNAFVNTLTGNAAANVLNGGAGADVMRGGAGNDIFHVDNAGDVVVENGSQGRDLVVSTVSFVLSGAAIHVEDLTLAGAAAINGTGNAFANVLTGNSGNNVLNGGAGADVMRGGAGNDTFHVDNVGDVVAENGSQGRDLIVSTVSFALSGSAVHVEDLTLAGSAAVNATGNAFANALTGNAAANVLNGGAGADIMTGGAGNDTYVVENAGDRVIELAGGGVDTVQSAVTLMLAANVENLALTGTGATNGTGNSGNNVLKGNAAVNALSGGDGADRLHGGLGSDSLTGGAGADGFHFDTALTSANIDRILDFSSVSDTIYLDRSVFRGIAASGTLAPAAFQTGTAANDAFDRIVYDQPSGRIFYDADGNGAGAAMLFATVAAGTVLTASDFSAYLPG